MFKALDPSPNQGVVFNEPIDTSINNFQRLQLVFGSSIPKKIITNIVLMTRCDYDTVFYRVFCVTLLAIAFTFTVILTNVFVDIDGLLASKKDKLSVNTNRNNNMFTKFTTESTDNDEINYSESEDSYRTKRSVETQSYLFHIKNPKVKSILANRLSTLLEELEAEETLDVKPEVKKITESEPKVVERVKFLEDAKKKDEILHLKLHNIILQGIANHIDLYQVFKSIRSLVPKVKEFQELKVTDGPKLEPIEIGKKGDNKLLEKPMEDSFLNEILNCKELNADIFRTTTAKPPKEPPNNVIIKTVIDISTIRKDNQNENDTKISKENIQGDIQLVYNGKVIKFIRPNAEMVQPPPPQRKSPTVFKLNSVKPKREPSIETTTPKPTNGYQIIPKSYMDKFVEEYFKHFPHDIKLPNDEINQHFETKRLKRHVRIKYENENSGEAKKTVKKNTEEDELYVEIETHFDSKGMKGEKKKKIVKNLIEKIQNAIHSDMTSKLTPSRKNNTTRHRKRIHFRKRSQNPLKHGNLDLLHKNNRPIIQRQLQPISKTVYIQDPIPPSIDTKSEEWKRQSFGPGFLSDTKAINSAEMSEVDVDYSKILEVNGIPQRLQQPLNTELSEETIKTNSYYDIGNSKYVVKNIDGSGFSVGINQYIDNPPDPEAMRIFAGLENMIQSYHQTYDPTPTPESTTEANLNDEEIFTEDSPYSEHTIERRSIKKHDYHSNEYKVIFDRKNRMPYNSYHDIYNSKQVKPKDTPKNDKSPLILDENIFDKNLKPSEILSLANLFQRKKREITKYYNRKPVNKFLNTNAMSKKTIYFNRKRNKRQINKIRIIATDMPENYEHSDENVFIVSGENIFADRAVVNKDVEPSDIDQDKHEDFEFLPYQTQNIKPESYLTNILNRKARQNPLMSKYPHIFMEEVSQSREDFHFPNNFLLPGFGKKNIENKIEVEQFVTSQSNNDTDILKQLQDQDPLNTSIGSPTSNYKVTVKLIPKNETDVHSGFKEMHTTINKSFNKNGLLYSSLVNVSEISKVMNLNSSTDEIVRNEKVFEKPEESFLTKKIYDQQQRMHSLLKEHAKHIGDQLHRLQEEKNNLEYILNNENNRSIKHLNYNVMTPQINVANVKDEVPDEKTAAGMVIKEAQSPIIHNESRRQLSPYITMQAATSTPDTQLSRISNKALDKDIISTIERNGNLTDQILKKIDKNTEILQVFLQKITERLEAPYTSTTSPKPERDDNTPVPDWRSQGEQFPHNMVIRKNDSHISIPFTYAFQTPTSVQSQNQKIPGINKPQVPIYQGHLRNYNLHNNKQPTPENIMIKKLNETENQSRFFIDGIENDYKVIQLGDFKKNRDYNNNMIHVNDTIP